MKRYQLLLLAALLVAGVAFAFTTRYRIGSKNINGDKGFALIELYTSEGCSSCPPADRLVAKIAKEYGNREVYVLAYHVDYWNHLGWRDVFSSPAYSQRQRTYATYLKLDGVYTPQAIVNGRNEFVGSDEGKMRSAIQQGMSRSSSVDLSLSNYRVNGHTASLQYHASGGTQHNTLMLAVIEKQATTQVKAGENDGRTLPHINIVQKLQAISLKNDAGNAEISLPNGFNSKDWGITGFIQNSRTGEIMAAKQAKPDDKETAGIR